jgi:hypothetical protein
VLRTKRCKHGLRCDSDQWLCEFCPPATPEEHKAKQAQEFVSLHRTRDEMALRGAIERDVLTALRSRECTTLAHVVGGVSATRGKKMPGCSVALCLARLQREGKVEGFRVVG